jgi:hypothetical protein
MKTTKLLGFSFKLEPIWMLVFAILPGVLGLLIALFVMIAKLAH